MNKGNQDAEIHGKSGNPFASAAKDYTAVVIVVVVLLVIILVAILCVLKAKNKLKMFRRKQDLDDDADMLTEDGKNDEIREEALDQND